MQKANSIKFLLDITLGDKMDGKFAFFFVSVSTPIHSTCMSICMQYF